MKRVLQLIGSFHLGGSERQAVQLTRLLVENDSHKIFLAAMNVEGILRDEAEKIGFHDITEFPLTSFYDANFFKQLSRAAKFMRENEIEIVQTHDFYTNVFGMFAATLARVPLKIAAKRETGGMRSKSQMFMERQAFRLADEIVANSEAVKNYLIAGSIPSEKINIIYNGLDFDKFLSVKKSRREICEKLNLPAGENLKFITLVANLRHAVKNQKMFLRAAAKVVQMHENAHFILAGEGELKDELAAFAEDMKIAGNVHFTGRCENVPELLSISEICVLTSIAEGFSNSIIEYMAAGKAVVATDVGGASEAVIEGETGYLVQSDHDRILAKHLNELLDNEQKSKTFGTKGREIAEGKFSLETQLLKTLELYEKIK